MSDDDRPKLSGENTYSFESVLQHMRRHHPGCPKKTNLTIAARVSAINWKGVNLGRAVGMELQIYIRHSLTDYDELIRAKIMTRDEARAYVAPHVREILDRWSRPAIKLRLVRQHPTD